MNLVLVEVEKNTKSVALNYKTKILYTQKLLITQSPKHSNFYKPKSSQKITD